jgi:predicted MPP superfamily phosphohydrolase
MRLKRLKRLKRLLIGFTALIVGAVFLYYQNNSIEITNVDLEFSKLPQEFNGLKIVQLSDLHNKYFGKNQSRLVDKIKKSEPDIIVITGDIVDRRKYDETPALALIDEIINIAPVYYVTGNHEFLSGMFDYLEKELLERGVKVLRNSGEVFERNGNKLQIIGVDDPSAKSTQQYNSARSIISSNLEMALAESEQQSFKLLLAHRPELFSIYSEYNVDLIFSGHAHGGQVRLPFIGGVVAPNQGFLPKYTSGKYSEGNSVLVVSRGLGNSIFPQRIFNRPEVVVVKLMKK